MLNTNVEWYGMKRECVKCGKTWPRTKDRRIKQHGACVTEGTCEDVPPHYLERPVRIRGRATIQWCGVHIHPTQKLRWHRGLLYCSECGSTSHVCVVGLANLCQMKSKNGTAPNGLTRLKKGQHPYYKEWPLPADAAPPNHIAQQVQ